MKVIGWLIGITLVLVVGLGVFVVMNSGNLLKTAVETLGPEYLGVSVSLESAEISLTEGTGELRGLVIGNPTGFEGPHAFSLGLIRLGLDAMAQSQELIVVRSIEVDEADLAIVARGRDTNLQAIMQNLEGEAGSAGDQSGEETVTADEPKIIIERFAFTDARTSLDSDLLGESRVEIPPIHLQDIGRKSSGVTIREALRQLFKPIVSASTEALAREQLNVDELKANAEQKLDEEVQERLGTSLDSLKQQLRN